jgi:hypothetical protein
MLREEGGNMEKPLTFCKDFSRYLPEGKTIESLKEEDGSLKLFIANWLKSLKSVKEVYRETKLPGGITGLEKLKPFRVERSDLSPDLLVQAELDGKSFWIALELKVCNKHLALLKAYDSILSYFIDYVTLGAGYRVESHENEVPIDVFAVATNYSPLGYLFKGEGKYDPNMIQRWKAYPATATYGRVLFHQRGRIRQTLETLAQLPRGAKVLAKDVHLSNRPLPHLGVLFCCPGKGGAQLLYSELARGYRVHLS